MPEKYFATIMKKTPVGEGDYIYTVDSVTAGDIDEATHILKTAAGQEYKRIDDFSDFENTTECYTNIIEVERITDLFNGLYTFSDSIAEYEKRCKEIVYYISQGRNGGYIMLPIDKRPYLTAMDKVQADPNAYEDGIKTIPNEETQLPPQDSSEEDDEEDTYIASLQDLVSEVVAGKYSPDQLIDIKYRLKEHQEVLEAAIESVDLHSDALEEELDRITGNSQESVTVPNPTPLAQSSSVSPVELINVDDLFDKVTKVLVAQDKPARRVIVELSRLDRMRKKGYGLLLTGESGVGKSLLMSLLGRYLNRPVLHIDSTQLTAQGFVGQSLEQKLWELYEDNGKDLAKVERAIVFFDEIDKKGSEKKSDISGQAVLNMLLKFLDGTTYTACKNSQVQGPKSTVRIDTSNMIVVFGGAFLDVYNQEKKQPIGFASQGEKDKKEETEPTISDFVNKSMMTKEFMGRVPVIVHLNSLDADSIRRILLESDDSALKIQEEVFESYGVKLTTKDGYILAVAKKALDEKIGARGLNKLITDTTWQAYDQVASHPGVYEEVILTEETVANEESFQLVKKKTTNKKVHNQ